MDWYIPITIIPGIGMMILSTTNQMMGLSAEIERMLAAKCDDFQHLIVGLKVVQLKRLTTASTLLYTSAACYVISGISGAITDVQLLNKWVLAIAVLLTLSALIILIVYSYKAIKIRRTQYQNKLINQKNNE